MGYWAKDGSYVREEDDLTSKSQYEMWDEQKRSDIAWEEEEKRRKQKEESDKNFRIWIDETDRQIAEDRKNRIDNFFKQEEEEKYNLDPTLWLKKPRNLAERRARADYWRTNSAFTLLISKINGKGKKFDKLWDQFSHAKDEGEKKRIVEEMEKLYPTTKSRLASAERKEGRGR